MVCENCFCVFHKEDRCTYPGEIEIDMLGNCMSAGRILIDEDLLEELKRKTKETWAIRAGKKEEL